MIKRFLFVAASACAVITGSAAVAETLPAFRVLTGAPVSPASAFNAYGLRDPQQTHTFGLCRDYNGNAAFCPSSILPRAPEVTALAEGLKRDPNLIYEYVRNGIETEFVFGSHKGALGAIITRSGTAFDQATLLVELMRASGFNARYRFGDIALSRQQFYDWTGIEDAQAACRFLAAGAIPATVNGVADCNVSGLINGSGVVMAHVWVEADIGGSAYQFDPSFKPHEFRPGIDVRAALGSAPGAALSTTLQTAQTGDGGVTLSNLNQTGLASFLASGANTLVSRLEARDMQSADLTTAVGGGLIKPATRPANGWRDSSLTYVQTVRATRDEIPDVYRARIKLSRRTSDNNLRTYGDFFTDEVFGRKLEVISKLAIGQSERVAQVQLDTVPIKDDPEILNHAGAAPAFLAFSLNLRLEFDHPFVDASYGDDVLERVVAAANPVHVMFAPGPVTPALGAKWSAEQAGDRAFDTVGCGFPDEGGGSCSMPFGDAMRAGLSASWLSQSTAAATIHAALANSVAQQQHSIGFFYSPQGLGSGNDGEYFIGGGEVADIVSGFSLTSKTNDAARRRAALHAIAATFSVLEGSVAQQASDSTDATSTARRFGWANAPGTDSDFSTPRAFKSFAAGAAAPLQSEFLMDGHANTQTGQAVLYGDRLRNSIAGYLSSDYAVVAAMDAILGPGERTAYTNRGGAFLATRYVGSDPVEIAHVSLSFGNESKGGGLPNSTAALSEKLIGKLKDNFQDRSNALGVSAESGLVSYTSPELATVGSGEFPYRLTQKLVLVGGGLPASVFNPETRTQTYSTSMGLFADNDLQVGSQSQASGIAAPEATNDGMAALGAARLSATAPTLAAFAAMQDIWSAAPSTGRELAGLLAADWWTWRLIRNTVTVQQGGARRTFARTTGSTFREPGGAAVMTVTGGERQLVSKLWNSLGYVRGWCPIGNQVRFELREGNGQTFKSGADYGADANSFCGVSSGAPITPTQTMPSGVTLTLYGGQRPENRYATLGWKNSLGRGFVNHMPYDPNEVVNSPEPFIHGCYSSISGTQQWATTAPVVLEFKNDAGKAYRLRFRPPVKRSVGQRPDDSCKLEAVFTPDDLTTPNERYVYDATGKVIEAYDAIAIRQPGVRKPYRFYVAEGYRGEKMDPLDRSYVVESMPAGGGAVSFPALDPLAAETIPSSKLKRNIDELGRVTTTLLDGRGRTLERDYPEHNKIRFRYDDRDNVLELRQVAKPGFTDPDIVTRAAWDATWNKPSWIRDARGARTDFTYWSTTAGLGQIYQVTQPAVAGGQPVTTVEYGANGLPSRKTAQQSSGVTVVAQFGYNSQGDLTEVVQDPGGLNIRSCSRYDAKGDVKETIDPRAGLSACPQ